MKQENKILAGVGLHDSGTGYEYEITIDGAFGETGPVKMDHGRKGSYSTALRCLAALLVQTADEFDQSVAEADKIKVGLEAGPPPQMDDFVSAR